MVIFLPLLSCSEENRTPGVANKNTIVLVKYKTQPHKAEETLEHLTALIKKVRQEPHFVDIKLHIDPIDSTNILLYEEWEDQDYYKDQHRKTPYQRDFMKISRNFLAAPPDISYWQMHRDFKAEEKME